MPYVSGFLRVREGGGNIDNTLPGHEGSVDPGYGIDLGHGIDNSLPEPPPGIWPPPSHSRPVVPIIDNTLPVQPGTIWPSPGKPARPDNTLPTPPSGQPPRPDHTLPSQKYWIVCGIPGIGWRYVCIDPSLSVGNALPPHAEPRK
jgi:hypothetical protein